MKLTDCLKNFTTISIVGMAKNSGKTVVLNHLIDDAYWKNELIGITSIGRDGEGKDLVTNTHKPKVYIFKGTLFATASAMLELENRSIEIIKVTNHSTVFGNIVIAKALDDMYLQLVGPRTNKGIKEVCDIMIQNGANRVYVDGALDRVSSASPSATEACILASGASLSRDLNVVLRKTKLRTSLFKLDKVDEIIGDLIDEDKITLINTELEVDFPKIKTIVNSSQELLEYVKENTKYIYLPGAITFKGIKDLIESWGNDKWIIVKDGSRIFIEWDEYSLLLRKNIRLLVLREINLIAITINPLAPQGYFFNKEIMKQNFIEGIEDIQVFNILG